MVGEKGNIEDQRIEIERMRKDGKIKCEGKRIEIYEMGRKSNKEKKKKKIKEEYVSEK